MMQQTYQAAQHVAIAFDAINEADHREAAMLYADIEYGAWASDFLSLGLSVDDWNWITAVEHSAECTQQGDGHLFH